MASGQDMGGAPLSWKREVIRTSFSVYPPIKPSHTNIEKEARRTSGAHEWRPSPARRRGGRGEADRPLTAAGTGQGQRNSLSANRVVASSPGPSLAFCSSGGRSETLLGLRGGQTRGRRVSIRSGLCVVRFLKEETQPLSLFLEDSH